MSLTTVLMAMAANPSYLSSCPQLPSIYLEKSTPHGGKFWKAVAHPHGLALHWGRRSTAGQGKVLNLAHCDQQNPVQEMMARALCKIHEGYELCALLV